MNSKDVLNTPAPMYDGSVDEDKSYDIVDESGNLIEKAEEVPVKTSIGNLEPFMKNKPVRLPRVIACGHKLDLGVHPAHRNCDDCWFAWMQNNPRTVETADELFQAGNKAMIEQLQGTKFLKKFLGFMSLIAKLKAQGLVEGQEGAQV